MHSSAGRMLEPYRNILTIVFWLNFFACSASLTPDGISSLTLESCPSVCFCDETNYVNCVGDGLWDVPTDIPRTVTRLELRSYVIGTLSVSALRDVVELLELKLQQTKIHSIENGTFGNLTRLLRLDLSQNLLERINSAMFEGLTRLRYLDLSTNLLTDMDEAFVDLVNLEQLNLRDNLLPSLTTKSFAGLYKVQYLNLDSNHIASVEVGTFQYLTNLAHLIVSNNPLTTLSRLDFFGSRLQYIDVSRVGLQRVPQSLTRYVRDLRLAKNNLTHVRLGDFDSYLYLSLLVLDDNCLADIESDALGRQEYLVRLWLNGNRLQQIPANLPPSLRVLYVEENLLKALAPYSFQGLFNLEQLFLQRNQIKRLDSCAFCDLLNLRHLDLQANLLESINEGAFANLSNLLSLDLSQNPLKMLSSGCFVGLDVLKTLQLSRMKTPVQFNGSVFNPLKKLETLEVYDSPTFAGQLVNSTRILQGLRSVRELNLMHNNLRTLRSDFPNFFPQLKVAKLSGNQWNCDRKILWLAAWIKKADTHFYHSYGIRCSQPEGLLYKPIMMLQDEDFTRVLPLTSTAATPSRATISLLPNLIPETSLPSEPTSPASVIETSSTSSGTTFLGTNPTPWSLSVSPKATAKTSNVSEEEFDPDKNNITSTTSLELTTAVLDMNLSTITVSKTSTTAASATTLSPEALTGTPSNETAVSESEDSVANATTAITHTSTLTESTGIPEEASAPTSADASSDLLTNLTTIYEEAENVSGGDSVKNNAGVPLGEARHDDGMVVAAASVATGLGLLLIGLTMTFFLFRCRKGYYSVTSPAAGNLGLGCQMRRSSSSISYSPQRDEVSIVTVSEGTVGLHTLTHQGLSNKLYFVLENGSDPSSRDLTKEALPDPSLQELLPDEYSNVRHHSQARTASKRKTSTYCFT